MEISRYGNLGEYFNLRHSKSSEGDLVFGEINDATHNSQVDEWSGLSNLLSSFSHPESEHLNKQILPLIPEQDDGVDNDAELHKKKQLGEHDATDASGVLSGIQNRRVRDITGPNSVIVGTLKVLEIIGRLLNAVLSPVPSEGVSYTSSRYQVQCLLKELNRRGGSTAIILPRWQVMLMFNNDLELELPIAGDEENGRMPRAGRQLRGQRQNRRGPKNNLRKNLRGQQVRVSKCTRRNIRGRFIFRCKCVLISRKNERKKTVGGGTV